MSKEIAVTMTPKMWGRIIDILRLGERLYSSTNQEEIDRLTSDLYACRGLLLELGLKDDE